MEEVTEFESQKKEFYNIALKSRTCFNDIVETSLFAYGGKFPQEVGHHVQYVLKEYDALFSAIEKASEEDDLAALEDRPDELENQVAYILPVSHLAENAQVFLEELVSWEVPPKSIRQVRAFIEKLRDPKVPEADKRNLYLLILEEHDFLKELDAKEVPVIKPMVIKDKTLFSLGDISYALFPKKGGRAVDEFDKDSWENLGRHMARIHAVGEMRKHSKRIAWKPSIATKHHIKVLHGTDFLPKDFRKPFDDAAELFIKKFDKIFKNNESILIHGDCHKGNLINRPGEGIWIIDFDDICMGPPVQDLWMLLPGGVEDSRNEIEWFLKGYETFRPFDIGSLSLIPALRGMRMIHFVSWLAVQSKDPHFSKHFPETGTPRYWNELIKELQQIMLWIL